MSPFSDKHIVLFLEGKLSDSEADRLIKEVKKDSDLAERVVLFRNILLEIQYRGRQELLDTINQISPQNDMEATITHIKKSVKSKGKAIIPIWIIVASILLLSSALFLFRVGEAFDPEVIFKEQYKEPSIYVKSYIRDLQLRRAKSSKPNKQKKSKVYLYGKTMSAYEAASFEKGRMDSLIRGLQLFEDRQWDMSIRYLEGYVSGYLRPEDDHTKAMYFLSKCYVNQGDYPAATDSYLEFLRSNTRNPELKDLAMWERALSLLHTNPMESKRVLQTISERAGHTYQDNARVLLHSFD